MRKNTYFFVVFHCAGLKGFARLDVMKELLAAFGELYYIDLLSFLTSISVLLVMLFKKPQELKLTLFKSYVAAYFLLRFISYLPFFTSDKQLEGFIVVTHQHCDFAFTLFEYFAFSYFLKEYINKFTYQTTTLSFYIIAITIYLYSLVGSGLNQKHLTLIFNIQAFCLILLCISYFLRLFRKPLPLYFMNEPSFWVATGLTFFMTSTLPFSIMSSYLFSSNEYLFIELFPIFYLFYTLLFLMILKGYLCKPVISK